MKPSVAFLLLCGLLCATADYYLPLSVAECTSSGSCSTSMQTGLVLDKTAASSMSQSAFQSEGITSTGTTLTMTSQQRMYLVNASHTSYQPFHLLNMEFTFDVNTAGVGCGGNGALYFTAMSTNSNSGFSSGQGYCDAPSGCPEFDVWEANTDATAMTAHPCQGGCDTNGCQYNPYKNGKSNFYGPGSGYTINSQQPFTVVTQFITSTGTSSGTLTEVNRFYIQNGVKSAAYSLSTSYCNGEADGGLAQMGSAMANGMVLIFSLWSANNGGMSWLDVQPNGLCPNAGSENYSSGSISFGNIKIGPIGSTTGGGSSSTSSSSSSSGSTSTSSSSSGGSTTGSNGGLAVYTDSLQGNWQSWSWGTENFQCTTQVHSGTYSICFLDTDYQAVYFHTTADFAVSAYTYIQFWVYAPIVCASGSGSPLSFSIYGSSGTPIGNQVFPSSTIPANQWTLVNIPLASFGQGSAQMSGFIFEANTSGNDGTFIFDDVYLK